MSDLSRRRRRLLIQTVGFLVSLFLLGWVVRIALQGENREQLQRLSEATPADVAWLIGLSALSIGLNGLIFWVTIRPVQHLTITGVQAVNAIAYLASYLPFKLSVVARGVIHHRRDRVPLARLGAWFAAIGVIAAATLTPLGALGAAREKADWVWIAASLVLVTAIGVIIVLIARAMSGERGVRRAQRIGSRIPVVQSVVHTRAFADLHGGMDMLASPAAVSGAITLRLIDLGVQAARIGVAADILGMPIAAGAAVLFASVYFLAGVIAPFGVLGPRELAMGWVAGAIATGPAAVDTEAFNAAVPLLVTAAEIVTALAGAAIGIAWLGPHRLLTPVVRMIEADAPGTRSDQPDSR